MRENIGSDHCILNGVVDADAANGRHYVRGIANEEQSWPVPERAAAGFDGEKSELMPLGERVGVRRKARFDLGDALANCFYASAVELLVLSLREDERRLPVVVALQKNEDTPAADAAERASDNFRLAGQFGKAEPQHIHRRGSLNWLESSQAAKHGKTSIGGDRQRAAYFVGAIRGQVTNPVYGSIVFHQLGHIGVHHEFEARIPGRLASDEFEEARLRDKQDVRETRLQSAQIEGAEEAIGELDRRPGNFGVGNFLEFVRQANLVEDFEGGRMNGVAAEFAVEVPVHLQQRDGNAASREEQRQHRARGTAADDTAGSLRGA